MTQGLSSDQIHIALAIAHLDRHGQTEKLEFSHVVDGQITDGPKRFQKEIDRALAAAAK
jgi:hypothetical protein